MSMIKEINSSIEILERDMDWLGKSIDMEEDIEDLRDQFGDAERSMQDLTENVKNLIEILEELV